MIEYTQKTGDFYFRDGDNVQYLGKGWAGNGAGKNNPDMQNVVAVGPLPKGIYKICAPVWHARLGQFAMKLIPNSENEMFGRNDFWIHGPSLNSERYGQESKGCPIADRLLREKIWNWSAAGTRAFVVL